MVRAVREPSAHASAKAYKIVLAKSPKVNLVCDHAHQLACEGWEDSLVLVC